MGILAPIPGRAQAQPHTSRPRASGRPGPHSRLSTGGQVSQNTAHQAQGARTALPTGRYPAPRHHQEAPRSTQLPPTPELQAGPPGSRTSPHLQQPWEPPRPTERGGHPTHKHHLNLHPLTGQGGVVPTSWITRAAGCNAVASPALITGGQAARGTEGPQLVTCTPSTGPAH